MTPTGITIAPDIPYEEWERLGEQLHMTIDAAYWAIGGWAAFGEAMYGDTYTRAVSPDRSRRVEQALWVHRKVPSGIRRENLSHSHHRAVAGLADVDVMRRLLDMAEANNWQVATLAAAVKRAKETAGADLMPWQPVEPDTATRLFGATGRTSEPPPSNADAKINAAPLRVVAGTDIEMSDDPYPFFWALAEAARDAIAEGAITDALKKAVADIDALEAISKRSA